MAIDLSFFGRWEVVLGPSRYNEPVMLIWQLLHGARKTMAMMDCTENWYTVTVPNVSVMASVLSRRTCKHGTRR